MTTKANASRVREPELRGASRLCALCHKPGADVQMHLHTNVGTFLMIGDYAHALCAAIAKAVQS